MTPLFDVGQLGYYKTFQTLQRLVNPDSSLTFENKQNQVKISHYPPGLLNIKVSENPEKPFAAPLTYGAKTNLHGDILELTVNKPGQLEARLPTSPPTGQRILEGKILPAVQAFLAILGQKQP
ncbi:MAG: hypothetical protein KTR14_10655 [Vampirovibrio sp.]|nr:hypothetical protein [Vampirovibrio sp.]